MSENRQKGFSCGAPTRKRKSAPPPLSERQASAETDDGGSLRPKTAKRHSFPAESSERRPKRAAAMESMRKMREFAQESDSEPEMESNEIKELKPKKSGAKATTAKVSVSKDENCPVPVGNPFIALKTQCPAVLQKLFAMFDFAAKISLRRVCLLFAETIPSCGYFDIRDRFKPANSSKKFAFPYPTEEDIIAAREDVIAQCAVDTEAETNHRCNVLRAQMYQVNDDAGRRMGTIFPALRCLLLDQTTFDMETVTNFPYLKILSVSRMTELAPGTWLSPGCFGGLKKLDTLGVATYSEENLRSLMATDSPLKAIRSMYLNEVDQLLAWEGRFEWMASRFPKVESFSVDMLLEPFPLYLLLDFKELRMLTIERGTIASTYHRPGANFSLVRLPQLEFIHMGERAFIDDYHFLRHLASMQRFEVEIPDFDMYHFQFLSGKAPLTSLDLSGTHAATDELLEHLVKRKYPIESLFLNTNQRRGRITSDGVVRFLRWVKNLVLLSLTGQRRVTDAIFAAKGKYEFTLAKLELSETRVTRSGIASFKKRIDKKRGNGGGAAKIDIRARDIGTGGGESSEDESANPEGSDDNSWEGVDESGDDLAGHGFDSEGDDGGSVGSNERVSGGLGYF